MMKNIKHYLSANCFLLLIVMVMGVMLSSCDKDDKDEPKGGNELVGKWYYTEDGDTDYDDYFIFKSNGTGSYTYEDDVEAFDYTYDSKTNVLILNYRDDDSERLIIEWLSKDLVDFDNYGTYRRK